MTVAEEPYGTWPTASGFVVESGCLSVQGVRKLVFSPPRQSGGEFWAKKRDARWRKRGLSLKQAVPSPLIYGAKRLPLPDEERGDEAAHPLTAS